LLKESEWKEIFMDAGLSKVKTWHADTFRGGAGTLVITGKK
jgi:hypothetical protein